MNEFNVGECSVCGQGLVLMVKSVPENEFLLICDDCETQWDSPTSYEVGNHIKEEQIKVESAKWEDIISKGWDKYVLNPPI